MISMSLGRIKYGGVTIEIRGWMLVVGIPLMFSFLFWFINKVYSVILFIIAIIFLVILFDELLKG